MPKASTLPRFGVYLKPAFASGKSENAPALRPPKRALAGSDEQVPEYGHLGLWVYEEQVLFYTFSRGF